MKINTIYRQQLINNIYLQFTDSTDAARQMWETMSAQIILIVGKGGFNSLFLRAFSLAQSSFPWLTATSQTSQSSNPFDELLQCLEGQSFAEAKAANILLLTIFTDILATLIGEDLTIQLLRSAWGIEASDGPWREEPNE